METKARRHLIIAVYLAIAAFLPLLMWGEMVWLEGFSNANSIAAIGLQDLFLQLWLSLRFACLVLSVAYLTGLARSTRGSSILLGAIVLVAILGAVAKIFIVTIMLAPTAYVAYKGKMVPN